MQRTLRAAAARRPVVPATRALCKRHSLGNIRSPHPIAGPTNASPRRGAGGQGVLPPPTSCVHRACRRRGGLTRACVRRRGVFVRRSWGVDGRVELRECSAWCPTHPRGRHRLLRQGHPTWRRPNHPCRRRRRADPPAWRRPRGDRPQRRRRCRCGGLPRWHRPRRRGEGGQAGVRVGRRRDG